MNTSRKWLQSPPAWGSLLVAALALAAEVLLGHAKGAAGGFGLFLGRFHPLVLHLPIGVFILVLAAEAATLVASLRARVEPAIGLILTLLLASSLGALVLGELLSREGGFAQHTLLLHRRLALAAVVGASASAFVWSHPSRSEAGSLRQVYRALLGASFALLSLGAHFGGSLTHGDAYLTAYAPTSLRALLGAPKAAPATPTTAAASAKSEEPMLFSDVVLPLLRDRCVECHGPDKSKASLRLDSLAAILQGSEDGAVVIPGSANDSALVKRILLPKGDDDKMPPEDKPQLKPEEIELLRFWIDREANAALRVRDVLAPADSRALLEKAASRSAVPTSGVVPNAPKPADFGAQAPPSARPLEPRTAPSSGASVLPNAEPSSPPNKTSTVPAAPSLSAREILNDKCEKCHGPDKQKGKLRLDSLEAALAGGKHGAAIEPGNPDESLIIERVRLPLGDDNHMPPRKEEQPTLAEIKTLASWIRSQHASAVTARAAAPARKNAAGSASAPSSREVSARSDANPAPEPETNPTSAAPSEGAPRPVALYDVVARILGERCGSCHSGDTPSGGLRVQPLDDLVRGGDDGSVIVVGHPETSVLVQRMTLPLADSDHMPPDDEKQPSAGELELIRAWIAGGARTITLVDARTLSASAFELVRAAAEEPPAKEAPGAPQAEPSQPGQTASVERRETPRGHSGCAACAIGRSTAFEDVTGSAVMLALGAMFLARRRQRSSTAR